MSLSDKALIVRVSATAWTARRYDRATSQQLTDENKATRSAARVNQYLMAGADAELVAVNAIVRELREYVDSVSVVWDAHGGRLVTPFTWFNMQPELKRLHAKFEAAVAAFVAAYPDAQARAQTALGDLYDASMFPPVHTLPALFRLDVRPEALPLSAPSDPRYGMTDEELADLQANITRTVEERLEASLTTQWQRLHEEVTRLANAVTERETGKRQPIFETTVEKLRNTAEVLKEMNITNDAHIDYVCGVVLDALRSVGVDTLRNSAVQREAVRDATSEALRVIDGMLL